MIKKIFSIWLAVIIAGSLFVFSACNNDEKKIVIAIPFGHTKSVWETIAAEYTAKSGVKVDLLDKTAGYTNWLRQQIIDRDIVADIVTSNEFQSEFSKGIFTDYNLYLGRKNPYDQDKVWRTLLQPSAYRIDGNEGETYMLNYESVQIAMYYNKTFFQNNGLKLPRTYDELVTLQRQINTMQKEALLSGLVTERNRVRALYISGDNDSMIYRDLAWLVRIYADQYYRDLEPNYVSQENDYNYRVKNADWVLNYSDHYNDSADNVVFNSLRMVKDVVDGKLGPLLDSEEIDGKYDSGRFEEIFSNLKSLIENSGYVVNIEGQPNASEADILKESLALFSATSAMDALDSFYKGRAAMYMDGTGLLGQYLKWQTEENYSTQIDKFFLPPMGVEAIDAHAGEEDALSVIDPDGTTRYYTLSIKEDSAVKNITTRSLGGPNGFLSVVKKSQQQTDLAMDFMMFFMSKTGQNIRINAMSQTQNVAPSGSSLIKGVEYPNKWKNIFQDFGYNGECDLNPIKFVMGLGSNRITVNNYSEALSSYLYGDSTLKQFTVAARNNILNGVNRWIEENGFRKDCLSDTSKNPK